MQKNIVLSRILQYCTKEDDAKEMHQVWLNHLKLIKITHEHLFCVLIPSIHSSNNGFVL